MHTVQAIGRCRRLVLVCVAFALLGACDRGPQVDGAGWLILFNGTDLSNWSVTGDGNWRVEDRTITADAGPDASFLVSNLNFADFELELEFWADPETNSGVFFRCANAESIDATSCYEVNIFDARPDQTYRTGAIVNVAAPSEFVYTGGQWNRLNISAIGNRLEVVLNGRELVDAMDSRLTAGPIALQHGTGVVRFRSVRARRR